MTRNLEEVLTPEQLKRLISSGAPLKHYIGYEVSGILHIGQALYTMMKIKDLLDAGVEVTVFLADWHAWLNKKLNGRLETITQVGKEYLAEAFRAGALCVGADPEKINFVLGSELYRNLGLDYWATMIRVSKATTLPRMLRSTTIMGRKESEVTDAAMLIYPAMQSADIFCMNINIAHAGTDQRNVHIVARDCATELGFQKPVAIHAHLLQGLLPPVLIEDPQTGKRVLDPEASKMSKSKPNSTISLHDSSETIRRKINDAYAPEGVVEFNPILDWTKHLIFYDPNTVFSVKRDQRWGGDLAYTSYNDLERDYTEKKLHPQDLKAAVAGWLVEKLEPARQYFTDPRRKTALEEIERLTRKG